jgi:hypothetical protein
MSSGPEQIEQRYFSIVSEAEDRYNREHDSYRRSMLVDPTISEDERMLRIDRYNRDCEIAFNLEKACAMAQATTEVYGPLRSAEDLLVWKAALDMAKKVGIFSGMEYPLPVSSSDHKEPSTEDYVKMGKALYHASIMLNNGDIDVAQYIIKTMKSVSEVLTAPKTDTEDVGMGVH